MAESDPRKIRPFGKSSERRDFDSEEDPLVELARIVSEDRGGQGARSARAAPQPVEPTQRSAYSADLEAELLQELESSFSPRAPAKAAAPRPATAAPQPQANESDHLLRSIEAQLGDYERRAPAQPARPVVAHSDETASESRNAPSRRRENDEYASPSPGQQGWEPVAATPFPRVDARQRGPALPAEPHTREVRSARAPDEQQARRAAPDRPMPNSERDMAEDEPISRLPLRRRDRPDGQEARSHQDPRGGISALPAAGWTNVIGGEDSRAGRMHQVSGNSDPADYRGELRPAFDESDDRRLTARRPAAGGAVEASDFVSEIEPTYSDPTLDGHWEGEGSGFDREASDEPRVAPARASGSVAKGAAGPAGRGSRKGLLAAAGVLGVLVIGGAVLGLMRSTEEAPSGPPPVISAPAGDTKVAAPEQQTAETETAGEAVYNRVAGAAPSADEQVVEGAEEPREISRIVLPPPQNESDDALVKAVGDETTVAANAEGSAAIEAVAIGPRRVRTYVVKPDGTITASGAAPAAVPAPAPPAAVVTTPIEPVRVSTTSVRVGDAPAGAGTTTPSVTATTSATPLPAAPAESAPAPVAQVPTEPAPTANELAASEPETDAADAPPAAEPAPQPVAPAPAAEAPAEPAGEAPAQVASVAPAEPATPPASSSGSGGYVMQVSSQRSMNEAQSALAAMKQRYGSIVGNLESEVLQADLGDKGVYYRARIGRWESRAEAIEVCEALQAAGGSCFVTR